MVTENPSSLSGSIVSETNPTGCNVSDGEIVLSGSSSEAGTTVEYSIDG